MTTTAATSRPASLPPDDAHCLDCGYGLRDLTSNRCPECGRSFDPRDPWTMNVGRPYGSVAAFFLSHIGCPTHFAAELATFAVFWWTAGLPRPMMAMSIGLSGWAAIYAYRIGRAAARRVARRIYRQPTRRPPRSFVLLILITLSGLMIWTRLPVRVLFAVHRPGLEQVARYHYEQAPMLIPEAPVRSRVGIYWIDFVNVDIHGVTVHTRAGAAFRYNPDDTHGGYYYGERTVHLAPGWYYNTSEESHVLGAPVGRVLYSLERLLDWIKS